MSELEPMKRCSRCKRTLPYDDFGRNRTMRDGLQGYCRACFSEYYRERQEAKGRSVRVRVAVPRGHKRCPACAEVKPHAQWERNKTSSDGWASYCRSCRAERNRAAYFRRKYGLTEAERDDLVAGQMGVCPICLSSPAIHVDHDHATGKVRGVLCFSCNAALGQFKDRPEAMRRAISYVEGNVWKPKLVAPGVYLLPS
ncbi:endonuclease VII domain-containing protein [Streptomyces sp. N2-109]|uniref:Endonuclease VII domain-containing protein n=1 Tax=Streptomyces gossypii TaxID=2883101 RepID=A0ABT2JLG1_9ACTN|nr:endonuclease VII domain-containing protein [Streptomyces gossypii]MCT2588711.1 endonuclease VII domain-containing protein [Streptomyces gossypii]